MQHLQEQWFIRSREASNKGKGHIFAFGSLALRERYKTYYSSGLHKAKEYERYFEPNPFTHQYDLLVYCWINFRQILNEEIIALRSERKDDLADEINATNSLYGIKREDFLFGACELRWPSNLMNGSYRGPVVRDPWMEERAAAFSDEKYNYIISFGGGGQGKTLTFLALNLILWDHFIFTQKGSRCMISTTSKDKLESASWSYLQQLIHSTEKDISLYAGRGKIAGDYTIKRPNNKDVAGVFKGILLGKRIDDTSIVDKLTGAHGHPYVGYIMDEAQSTPEAPIASSGNYTMHAGMYKIALTGNYSEDEDTLGKNAKPSTGWDSVDEDTGKWMSYMQNNQPAIVLHFSNDRSPGMTEGGPKLFPYLPNKKKLDKLYPNKVTRTIDNKQYRRFWIGWRIVNAESDSVIVKSTIIATGCDKPPVFSSVLCRFFSFDSAQAEGDRNLLGEFVDGIDGILDERVWGLEDVHESVKSSEALKYYTECAKWIYDKAKIRGVKSGNMILDWTGRPAHAEILKAMGFNTVQFTYNQGVPNGKRKDIVSNRVLRPILVNPDPENRLYAHQIAKDQISFGAWLLQQYAQSGRIRGLNDDMLNMLTQHNGIDEEMYSRKFKNKISTEFGEMFCLASKKDFKNQYGFSPDLMDIWIQAAYFMFVHRGLPINPIGSRGNDSYKESDSQEEREDHINLWSEDLLPS